MSDHNRYSAWHKTIGKFDIYLSEYDAEDMDYTNSIDMGIRLTVKGNDSTVRRQVHSVLGSLARAISKGSPNAEIIQDITIGERFHANHKILGGPITEYLIDTCTNFSYLSYNDIEKLIEAEDQTFQLETIIGELKPDISNMKISLSCAFKDGGAKYGAFKDGGAKYVKVRFAGFSVQFFFNNQEWLRSKTERGLGLVFTKRILVMRVLDANADMILKRARNKAVNESGIGISTPIELHVLLSDDKDRAGHAGWKLALDDKLVSNPDVVPALLLREDSTNIAYLVDDNKIYTVAAWSRKKTNYEYGNVAAPGSWIEDLRFVKNDKTLRILRKHLTPAKLDNFTKKRIERAIKRKL